MRLLANLVRNYKTIYKVLRSHLVESDKQTSGRHVGNRGSMRMATLAVLDGNSQTHSKQKAK